TGNMGSAIIRGLLAAGKATRDTLLGSDTATERLLALADQLGFCAVTDNNQLVANSDVVVLAVKPQMMVSVLRGLEPSVCANKLFVSIAAGVTLGTIEQALPEGARVVRTMPNTPVTVLSAATAIARGAHATTADLDRVRYLFEAVGAVVTVDEAMLDAVTGLSGSGPAYVLMTIEALADGGVRMGLPRVTAQQLAAQTVFGTAKMVLESNLHPAQLRDNVTSPGGTTAAGLAALEAGALRHAFISAVEAATRRSIELGRPVAKP
ncbi:MAG TPA: pyrroline-5-carboxylate reductase, partial [Polyangiaceae bacterium]